MVIKVITTLSATDLIARLPKKCVKKALEIARTNSPKEAIEASYIAEVSLEAAQKKILEELSRSNPSDTVLIINTHRNTTANEPSLTPITLRTVAELLQPATITNKLANIYQASGDLAFASNSENQATQPRLNPINSVPAEELSETLRQMDQKQTVRPQARGYIKDIGTFDWGDLHAQSIAEWIGQVISLEREKA